MNAQQRAVQEFMRGWLILFVRKSFPNGSSDFCTKVAACFLESENRCEETFQRLFITGWREQTERVNLGLNQSEFTRLLTQLSKEGFFKESA